MTDKYNQPPAPRQQSASSEKGAIPSHYQVERDDAWAEIAKLKRENADLKQRLLPQYLGRAERAEKENADLRGQIRGLQAIAENLRIAKQREADDLRKAKQMADHERDAMLEELIAARGQLAKHERRYIDITMLTPHTEVAKIAFAGLAAIKEST